MYYFAYLFADIKKNKEVSTRGKEEAKRGGEVKSEKDKGLVKLKSKSKVSEN